MALASLRLEVKLNPAVSEGLLFVVAAAASSFLVAVFVLFVVAAALSFLVDGLVDFEPS